MIRGSRSPVLSNEPAAVAGSLLDAAIAAGREALLSDQAEAGYWSFELEADCTIPAEYVLMMHFMDQIDEGLQAKLAVYLRERQQADGGWPLYFGGAADMSCSVKAYFALKLAGDDPSAPHMHRARELILSRGGAARANVFTRIMLAQFSQIPWRGVPYLPVEIVLLPRWFPFHLSKVSYWSRTVMVPLLVLCTMKAQAKNPRATGVRELFVRPPDIERDWFPVRSRLNRALIGFERLARKLDPLIPRRLRRHALARAEHWILARLGAGGLGAIFPAMINAYEALAALGYADDHPLAIEARRALQALLVSDGTRAYCQPCVSPVWDTALACLAIQEVDRGPPQSAPVTAACAWLADRQLLEVPGDWRESRATLAGGGWPFQFENPHYPDLDDTAAAAIALLTGDEHRRAAERASDWLKGMQSRNGGFASFDADNDHEYLNEIPFADHGALLDPPTADVSARCVMLFALLGREADRPALASALDFLGKEQQRDGAWFGRWGTNYIYGTWSVLAALEHAPRETERPDVARAVAWLKSAQRIDGGWGEDNDSYADPSLAARGRASTSFQTAWALLGLMSAGEAGCAEVRRGIEYLLRTRRPDGLWRDEAFTAPGFPRVFYLKYHGYSRYFPLWALAKYRNLTADPVSRLPAGSGIAT
ncbi:MAG: squalene--hopene cyclase [Gammaproteobacteria bacterium]